MCLTDKHPSQPKEKKMVKYFIGGKEYTPGFYDKNRPAAEKLADQYISGLDTAEVRRKKAFDSVSIPPSISLSRLIGVGAVEIADLLAKETGLPVVDRQVLEHIAATRDLSQKAVHAFDRQYPGKLKESLSAIFGEKSFAGSESARELFTTVFSVAGVESNIFVGRGTHLMLPRERVLAVRIVASKEFRVRRLSESLGVAEEEAEKKIADIDAEQNEYYRTMFGRSCAEVSEFDLVINRDFLRRSETAAKVISTAFAGKFGGQVRKPAAG